MYLYAKTAIKRLGRRQEEFLQEKSDVTDAVDMRSSQLEENRE